MLYSSFDIEFSLWNQGLQTICGVDEVGRGSFAGPVVSGAVVFPVNSKLIKGIADSKLLKPKQRQELNLEIKDKALAWSIAEVDVSVINQYGIVEATQNAFKKAVEGLSLDPEFILIDAFYIKNLPKEKQRPIVRGDQICASISAASIIAKVYRDQMMQKLDLEYPGYGFFQHKGYGTLEHQQAIKKLGLSKLHRTSFKLNKFL